MLLMSMLEAGTEVGKRYVRRASGISREEIRRLPDSATGPCYIHRVAGSVGWIHGDRTDLAGGTVDWRRANRRPLLTGQTIGLAEREDAEALGGVITAVFAQPRGRERLLKAQRPTAENTGLRAT